MKSANLVHMDALWRAYVNADPDLHRLEHRKQVIAHRRARKAHAKRVREEAGRAIIHELATMAGRVAICGLFMFVFILMAWLA